MSFVLGTTGGRQWWEEDTFGFSSDFRGYVEAKILRPEKAV